MLNSRLSVYVWGPAGDVTQFQDISDAVESLSFSNLAPGGFGSMSGLVRLTRAGVPRPQFGLFARVAVYARPTPLNPTGYVWLGELMNPSYGLTQSGGDYIRLSALGIGNGLRDTPTVYSYSGKSPQFIAQDQLFQIVTNHGYMTGLLSTDNSQLFPDNPAVTITQTYDNRTNEEILSDIALLAGDYSWGVESDPTQRDVAGFPLGRVFARKRDLASVDFQASIAANDVMQAEFTPTADRAYNRIEVDYPNGTNGVGKAVATDSRLGAGLSQGTAPFRLRKYVRDLSGLTTIDSAIAQSIADTYLALFEDVTYQGTLTLRGLRDGSGAPIPLWCAQAGYNLYVPEMAIQAQTLPSGPTQNSNLFWITSATYHEDSGGTQYLALQVGYLPNTPDALIARLQMVSDALGRSGKVTNIVQAQGAQLQGYYGFDFSNALAGQNVGVGVTFQGLASNVPTSLTLAPITTTNVGGLTATSINARGAHIGGTATTNGSGSAIGTYVTVGNCLRHVNTATGRVSKHCDGCDATHTDLAIAEHAYTHTGRGRAPGVSGLAIACPGCGAVEAYNTALTAADEQHGWAHRAEQARLIRQLMAVVGLERA